MSLRHALDDYRRHRDAERLFPGEFRTADGRFSGTDDRLVHVARDGSLRDYSYPLSGLAGVERSRFGVAFHDEDVCTDDNETPEIHWFDGDHAEQRYVAGTLIETVHTITSESESDNDGEAQESSERTVVQRDHTDGRVHRTRFETDAPDASATLYAYVEFLPDRSESQLALLDHGDAVEAYHRREHDYLAVADESGDATLSGEIPARLGELVDDSPTTYPKGRAAGRYEDTALTGGVVLEVPFSDGIASIATLPTDGDGVTRETALETVRSAAAEARDGIAGDTEQSETETDSGDDMLETVLTQDRRVLELLSAPDGGRIAGPDFDPFYTSSGGYGYTWFRDDAEIARFLLETDERFADLHTQSGRHSVTDHNTFANWHDRAASFYAETQREDGSWPHRVWPSDGALAPGWANARLESGDDSDYQADQTASVTAFLARYLRTGEPADPERVRDTLLAALDALEDTLADDGLPIACQNAWENMQGRFSHTAFTFLHAYAALLRVADDPGLLDRDSDIPDRAREGVVRLLDGIEKLWLPDERRYALRLTGGENAEEIDDRADAASLAAVGAFHELAASEVAVPPGKLDRLVAHVDNTVRTLYRETDAIRGLIRFEGDDWRQGEQENEKVWTVSTAWGAHASATLATLLHERGDDRAAAHDAQARALLGELLPGGSLLDDGGYLPEQLFDDGTPDCARPLGWPHALRTATATELATRGELYGAGELVGDAPVAGNADD
jgi:glucoamylase